MRGTTKEILAKVGEALEVGELKNFTKAGANVTATYRKETVFTEVQLVIVKGYAIVESEKAYTFIKQSIGEDSTETKTIKL